jgi:hypothetical protein
MKAVFAALLLALMTVSCSAAESCPPTAQQGDWDAACFAGSGQQRQVKPAHLAKIVFDHSGHAVIRIAETFEMVAVDRRGRVVVPGIYYATDFDYPKPRGHLARFVDGGKCGYFDVRDFKVAIPAIYDNCMSFMDESANVCRDCTAYCTDADCHDSLFVGGKGLQLDRRNRVLRQFDLPTIAQACPGGQSGTLKPKGGGKSWLDCPEDPTSPFKMEASHGR